MTHPKFQTFRAIAMAAVIALAVTVARFDVAFAQESSETPAGSEAAAQKDHLNSKAVDGEPLSKSEQAARDKKASARRAAIEMQAELDAQFQAKLKKEREIRYAKAYDHYMLATHYLHHWDFKTAGVELREAIVFEPTMKAAHRDFFVVSMMHGNFRQSLAEFMMTVGLGEPLPYEPEQIAALDKEGSIAHYNLGVKFGKKKRWVPAIAEFRWAHDYAPNDGSIERSLAFAYSMNHDFKLAEEHYKSSFEKNPADGFSHADLAEMLVENGQTSGAMDQMSEAVRLEPNVAALHVDMAWIAESSGDLKTAQTEYVKAVKLSPNHAGLWAHLGNLFQKVGKPTQAEDAYKHALALDSSLSDVQSSLGALRSHDGTSGGEHSKTGLDNAKQAS